MPSPTGTEIGAPVATTAAPRFKPSHELMAMARTPAFAEMLLHFEDELGGLPVHVKRDLEGFINQRKFARGEIDVTTGR
ncbi:MAG: hypothetical protein WDN28_00670 [Chthoniobacter sp.]